MDDSLVLKNKLKEMRAERGLSQAQLAAMVGVSRNTISSIETGQFTPTAKLALVLCLALDKKFEEIFYFQRCKELPPGYPGGGFVVGGVPRGGLLPVGKHPKYGKLISVES